MDGLDAFEKSLAAEKADRERQERHRRHDHDRERRKQRERHRSREREDRDRHRHKRSRHDEGERRRHRQREEAQDEPKTEPLTRDAWMTAPSALEIDYKQRRTADESTKAPNDKIVIHKNELNHRLNDMNDGKTLEELKGPAQHEVEYTFGDAGSQWRMTKLKAVYTTAEQTGRSVEDVALDRYGSLRDFDDAREEQTEVDRRKLYGPGYVGKEKPSGELFQERKLEMGIHRPQVLAPAVAVELPQGEVVERAPVTLDPTALNRLKAQMMKAKLKGSPDAAKLEAEYQAALEASQNAPQVVTIGVMESRLLAGTRGEVKAVTNKRGRERGLVVDNEDMTIEDMVREERRTKGQAGGEGRRLAERIAKDGKFDNDLDYMDENAEKLAKRIQKSEINLRNSAISEVQKMTKILDRCQLCHHDDTGQPPVAPVLALGTRVYLTLPTEPELSDGGAVIVPIQHRDNLLECDDDEWEEVRNFMKCLTRMYHDQGREVVFYENAAAPQRHLHAAMQAVPIPYELGATAPAFFREAILAADEEWTQHKKLIDTAAKARNGLGKSAFRKSIAKEMPYFHAWFSLDGGLGHVVEDSGRWPRGDLFAREILGGMLDVAPDVIKKQGRWQRGDGRVEGFLRRWRKFDWTRVLTA